MADVSSKPKPIPAALRRAIRDAKNPKEPFDFAFEMLANQGCSCISCGWGSAAGKVKDFGRHISDRAGLTIIDCECPDCGTKWKRVLPKTDD